MSTVIRMSHSIEELEHMIQLLEKDIAAKEVELNVAILKKLRHQFYKLDNGITRPAYVKSNVRDSQKPNAKNLGFDEALAAEGLDESKLLEMILTPQKE